MKRDFYQIISARNLRCFVFILERSIFCFNYYSFFTLTQKLKTSQKNYQNKHSIQFKLFEYSFEKYNSYE